MEHEMTVSLRTLLKLACEENARREMAKLPSPRELEAWLPETPELDHRVFATLKQNRAAQKHHGLRIVKRALIAAAILVSLLFCTLMANASVRATVVNTIIEWTNRDIGIQFEIAGDPLTALPEDYGPHYIPEGLTILEESSRRDSGEMFSTYESEEYILDIKIRIADGGSEYFIDNEHLEHDTITFNGVTAYYSHGTSVGGDEIKNLLWVKDGIEHDIYTDVPLSELFEIAENIY